MNNPFHWNWQYAQKHEPIEDREVTLIGDGVVFVEPNLAKIRLGVVTVNMSLSIAQQMNANTMNRVIDTILSQGISRDSIQTSDYTIRPLYDYKDGTEQFRGYEVSHLIDVQTKDIPQVGKLIDSAVNSGANRVVDVQFILQDAKEYERMALNFALEDAVSKARSLAKTMNVQVLTIPVSIEERTNQPPRLYQTVASLDSFESTPIEPGQLEIRAQIIAKFKY